MKSNRLILTHSFPREKPGTHFNHCGMDKRRSRPLKSTHMKTITLLLTLIFALPSFAANYKYSELVIKDYDEMLEMVQTFVNKAKEVGGEDGMGNEDEAKSQLREALKLIFSRPDSDNMVAKLVPEVRRVLVGYNAYEDTVAAIAKEAVTAINTDGIPVSVQSTSFFILDNVLGEVRPEAESNAKLRSVVQMIRDAKLKVSKDVMKERKIRGMFQTPNPSKIAEDILKPLEKKKK